MSITASIGEGLAAFFGSGILGSITGIIGSELKSRKELALIKLQAQIDQDSWPEKQKARDHEAAMFDAEKTHIIELHKLNEQSDKDEREHMITYEEVKAGAQGLAGAIDAESGLGLKGQTPPWLFAYIRATRPNLTYLLIIFSFICFWFVGPDVKSKIISTALFLTAASVLYWFGDRPSQNMRNAFLGHQGRG